MITRVWFDVWICYKPCVEMGIEGEPSAPDDLRAFGESVKQQCEYIAELVEKLTPAGWNNAGALYSVEFCKMTTLERAAEELTTLGYPELAEALESDDFEEEGFFEIEGADGPKEFICCATSDMDWEFNL